MPSITDYTIREIRGSEGEVWWKASRPGWTSVASNQTSLDRDLCADLANRLNTWREART